MKTDSRKILDELIKGIANTMKGYSRSSREDAWKAISSSKGQSEIKKIINSPNRTIIGTSKLLSFHEWRGLKH